MLCRIFFGAKYSESETEFGFEEIKKATFILLKVAFLRSCEKNRQRLNPENAKRQNMILILEFYYKNIEKRRQKIKIWQIPKNVQVL